MKKVLFVILLVIGSVMIYLAKTNPSISDFEKFIQDSVLIHESEKYFKPSDMYTGKNYFFYSHYSFKIYKTKNYFAIAGKFYVEDNPKVENKVSGESASNDNTIASNSNTEYGIEKKESNSSASTEKVVVVQLEKRNGVFYVPCSVNGIKLSFILDTGASDVSISSTEALFMLKNNYLTSDDIYGKEYYTDANGDISIGTKIILRKIEFNGIELNNVEASVVNNISAPLLLGQSAISKMGKIQIDSENSTLTVFRD